MMILNNFDRNILSIFLTYLEPTLLYFLQRYDERIYKLLCSPFLEKYIKGYGYVIEEEVFDGYEYTICKKMCKKCKKLLPNICLFCYSNEILNKKYSDINLVFRYFNIKKIYTIWN